MKSDGSSADLFASGRIFPMRAVFAGLEKLPWETACAIGERLGPIGCWPLGIRRHVVETQIRAAFPELDRNGVTEIAEGSYKHLGRNAVEAAILPDLGKDGVLTLVDRVDGWEHVVAPGVAVLVASWLSVTMGTGNLWAGTWLRGDSIRMVFVALRTACSRTTSMRIVKRSA